jgi:thioesterase domain-containing protein
VIPIQTVGSKPPFFGIGWAFLWRSASEHLGADQPVLCVDFDPPIVDRLHKPYSLEEFATHIVRAIREYRPQGPYFLGGFCDHAMLAYEASRQLLEQGHQVKLLAIIDARNHSYFQGKSYVGKRKPLWRRAASKILKLRELKKAETVPYAAAFLKEAWLKAIQRAQEPFDRARARRDNAKLTDLEQILAFAEQTHKPKPYRGRVALLRADTKSDVALSGWKDFLKGPVETHEIPGMHMGIFFEPHVQHLARRLALSLESAAALSTDRNNPGER